MGQVQLCNKLTLGLSDSESGEESTNPILGLTALEPPGVCWRGVDGWLWPHCTKRSDISMREGGMESFKNGIARFIYMWFRLFVSLCLEAQIDAGTDEVPDYQEIIALRISLCLQRTSLCLCAQRVARTNSVPWKTVRMAPGLTNRLMSSKDIFAQRDTRTNGVPWNTIRVAPGLTRCLMSSKDKGQKHLVWSVSQLDPDHNSFFFVSVFHIPVIDVISSWLECGLCSGISSIITTTHASNSPKSIVDHSFMFRMLSLKRGRDNPVSPFEFLQSYDDEKVGIRCLNGICLYLYY